MSDLLPAWVDTCLTLDVAIHPERYPSPIFAGLLVDTRALLIDAARTNAEMVDAYRWSPLPQEETR